MCEVEALFQGNSPTWCLLLRSFVSCEEDERSEDTRSRGTAHYNQIPEERRVYTVGNLFKIKEAVW